MSPLAERALFFGAGLLFGVVLGFLVGGGPEAPAAPSREASSPLREEAGLPEAVSAPDAAGTPAPRPVDPERLEALLAAVEARPEDPAARAAVGELYLEAGEFPDAAYWLRQARNLDATDLDLRSRLAFALFGLGDVPGAVAGYEEVLAEDPDHFESLLALGRLRLFVEQDLAAGIALWERAIASAPDSPEARALRAEIEALRQAHPR